MKKETIISFLVILIAVLAAVASASGIFSSAGPVAYFYESIRGETVKIFGKGLYRHMSAKVAPQGIAQDYVTLFIALPLLLISFYYYYMNSLKGMFLLAGTLSYFFVTYLFYLMMAMYNPLFIVYTALLACSFFALLMVLFSFDLQQLPKKFNPNTPVTWSGRFLLFNCICIAILWLGVVIPPLLDGSYIPVQTEHYTTLVVQGLDLGLLLPLGMVSAYLFVKRQPLGYLSAPIYLIFLSILMCALTAKLVAMANLGYPVVPAIFIIPVFGLAAITFSILILKNIKE